MFFVDFLYFYCLNCIGCVWLRYKSYHIFNEQVTKEEYKEFLEQKVFYKESFVNIADLREEIASFVLLVKDKLKYQ